MTVRDIAINLFATVVVFGLTGMVGLQGQQAAIAQYQTNMTEVAADAEGNTYYLDLNQIRRNGNVVQYEVFQRRESPNQFGAWMTVSTFLADCQRGYQTLIGTESYDQNTNLILGSEVPPEERTSFTPRQGSVGGNALRAACSSR